MSRPTPPNKDYPIRALVRGGSSLFVGMQGKVYWWREKPRVPPAGRHGYKALPGHYFGESFKERLFSPFANPVDIIIDPTDEQIEEEKRRAEDWNA